MKNFNQYKILVLSLTLLVFLGACSSDFLDEEPTTFVAPDILLEDSDGAETYLLGAYDAVQSVITINGGNGWLSHWGTIATDIVVVPPWGLDRTIIYSHQITPLNGKIRSIWEQLYVSLNRVNSVVDRVGAMSNDVIDVEDQQRIVGEAKYLRSMINFALVSSWENVPLITQESTSLNDLEVPQATPEEVYAFIIEDLKSAKASLPNEQGGGRATKGAAQALLAKVYLQMTGFPLNQSDKFALAATELNEVISSGTYTLLDYYPSVFEIDFEQSNEILYSIGYAGPGLNEGSELTSFYGPVGQLGDGGSFNTTYINQSYANSYETGDIRLLNNVAKHNATNWSPEEGMFNPDSWAANPVTWKPWKWHAAKPNDYGSDSPFDVPYIRYADVLLMYAEALNGQGSLTQNDLDNTVNRVRARARMEDDSVPNITLASQEENARAILAERRKELALEGWRRNDLVRFGVYKETIIAINQEGFSNAGNPGPNYNDFEIRWPIPLSEIELNSNLVQNEGY